MINSIVYILAHEKSSNGIKLLPLQVDYADQQENERSLEDGLGPGGSLQMSKDYHWK